MASALKAQFVRGSLFRRNGKQVEMQLTTNRRTGAIVNADGGVTWRVWAPHATQVELVLWNAEQARFVPMDREEHGFFSMEHGHVSPGQLYTFRLDQGPDRADPCSLWQPRGVTGPSAVFDPAQFRWTDQNWRGIPRRELVFYELHVGTFTPEGTFEAIVPRLASLRELGVTALQIMPVGQFPGGRNWGYDGVLPYAAQNTYGGPQGLQKLVDAAHEQGLAVYLDVVYNHFGPESNYLREFGDYFTHKYNTPWGDAINYDDRGSDAVRDFVLDNARMWLEEFHIDGLRLDAVHALYDLGARHILRAISDLGNQVAERSGRQIEIIGESDLNDPRILYSPEKGGYGLGAQWSDDFHHVVHAFLTGERRGYYSDYGCAEQVARVLNTPFIFAWDYSRHRRRKHGAVPDGLSGDRFVVCIQNHDQVGNRAIGDRLSTILQQPAKLRLAASLMLLAPHLPLLFMGEEYGETRPFPFFCSFAGADLIDAVRKGRKKEFAAFVSDADQFPDPDSRKTFDSAKLSWSWPKNSSRAKLRSLYQDLLAARRTWPALTDFVHRSAKLFHDADGGGVIQNIRGGNAAADPGTIEMLFNLDGFPRPLPRGDDRSRRPFVFSSELSQYGGDLEVGAVPGHLVPFECRVFG